MLKKIIFAAAITATTSFATWDYFPVLESHKGQAKIAFGSEIQDPYGKDFVVTGGVRFSPATNFEFGIQLPYTIFHLDDDNDLQTWNGTGNLMTMFRYQFLPTANAFLDIQIPTANSIIYAPDYAFAFHFGAQFSKDFGLINLGSELGFNIETRGEDKISPPCTANLGLETDFQVTSMFTPYLGIDLAMLFGKFTYEGENYGKSHTGELGVSPFAGLSINFNSYVSLDLHGGILLGKDYLKTTTLSDKAAMTAATTINVNF